MSNGNITVRHTKSAISNEIVAKTIAAIIGQPNRPLFQIHRFITPSPVGVQCIPANLVHGRADECTQRFWRAHVMSRHASRIFLRFVRSCSAPPPLRPLGI